MTHPLDQMVRPFDKAVLTLYRDDQEIGIVTFERDEYDQLPVLVRLENEPVDENYLLGSLRYALTRLAARPLIFRVESGRATIQVNEIQPTD